MTITLLACNLLKKMLIMFLSRVNGVNYLFRLWCVALAFTDDALEKLQAKIDQLEKRDQQLLKESKQLKKELVRLEMENENLQAARDHIKDIKDMLY